MRPPSNAADSAGTRVLASVLLVLTVACGATIRPAAADQAAVALELERAPVRAESFALVDPHEDVAERRLSLRGLRRTEDCALDKLADFVEPRKPALRGGDSMMECDLRRDLRRDPQRDGELIQTDHPFDGCSDQPDEP